MDPSTMAHYDETRQSLLHGTDARKEFTTDNVDKLFDNIYKYYIAKGIGAIILSELCSLLTLGFTIIFSVILLGFVDWAYLIQCHDEDSCKDSIILNPFQEAPTMFTFFVFLYFVLFGSLWIYQLTSTIGKISDGLEMSSFYEGVLGIKIVELQHIEWFEVVDHLIAIHNSGKYRMIAKDELTVHDVVLRIMRKENYLVGLINKNTLDLYVPWWISPFTSEQLFLTQSLEWSLSFCILNSMFTDDMGLSGEFINDVAALQWRFQVIGLIHFLLLPFLLIYMAVNFFLQNAQQFHSSKAYLGPRQWSPLALWKFREFNELPHVFEDRMNKSQLPANEYINTFHNPYLAILARCTTYIAGAFIATLLLASLLSDGALLYVHVLDYNLLWYLGVFSACYAAARSQIPDETKPQTSAVQLLGQVCAHTHYYPEDWKTCARSELMKAEICDLFQFKAQIFLMELLSVVLTPAVLCFSLPACADRVLNFIKEHTSIVQGVGAVCDFSLFEFEKYGDEAFGAEQEGTARKAERANGGKMEKSFVNFYSVHPNFNPGGAGKVMHSRLTAFKDNQRNEQRETMLASIVERSGLFRPGRDGSSPDPDSPLAVRQSNPHQLRPHVFHHQLQQHQQQQIQLQQQHLQHQQQQQQQQQQQYGYHQQMHGSSGDHGPGDSQVLSEEGSGSFDSRQPQQPPYGQQANNPTTIFRIQSTPGAYGAVASPPAVVSRPVSEGLGVGESLPPGPTDPTTDDSTAQLRPEQEQLHLLPPLERHSSDDSVGGSHMFEGAFSSGERKTSVSDLDSENGEVMSPIVTRNGHSPRIPHSHLHNNTRTGKPMPSAMPAQIEMSSLFDSSRQHQSIMRGPAHENRSLLESGTSSTRRSSYQHQSLGNPYAHRSKSDLPSVLMSVMRQENIDFENDFYWMDQFRAVRQRDRAAAEHSATSSPRRPMFGARRTTSGGGTGNSSIMGGFVSPQSRSRHNLSTPPFVVDQAFSPGPGLDVSGMYLSGMPGGGGGGGGTDPSHSALRTAAVDASGATGHDSSPPSQTHDSSYGNNNYGDSYSHNYHGTSSFTTAGGATSWGPGSAQNTAFVPHSVGNFPTQGHFRPRTHGPPSQKRAVSGFKLDCLTENDAEES